jgi:hypothetical protein
VKQSNSGKGDGGGVEVLETGIERVLDLMPRCLVGSTSIDLSPQDVFAAKPKQGPDTVADLLVGREQFGEVTILCSRCLS